MSSPNKPSRHNRVTRAIAALSGVATAAALATVAYASTRHNSTADLRATDAQATAEASQPLSTEQRQARDIVTPKLAQYGTQLAAAYDAHRPGTVATPLPGTGDGTSSEYVVFDHQPAGNTAVEGIMRGTTSTVDGQQHLTLHPDQTSLISWANHIKGNQTRYTLSAAGGATLAREAADPTIAGTDNMVWADGVATDIGDQPGYGAYTYQGPGDYIDPNGTKLGFDSYSDGEKIDYTNQAVANAAADRPVFS